MERILNKFEERTVRTYGWEGMKMHPHEGCDKFEKGKKYIFDYCKYYRRMKQLDWTPKTHNFEIDGMEVQEILNESEGIINGKVVHPHWCKRLSIDS